MIGIIGAGYVGITLANYFADTWDSVLCYEKDCDKRRRYVNGEEVTYEPNLQIKKHIDKGKISFVDLDFLLDSCFTVFICVGTPSKENGEVDLTQIFDVAREIKELKDNEFCSVRNIVIRSTVPPGTTRQFEKIINEEGRKVNVYFIPEFLREGSAVYDTANPERMVLGTLNDIKSLPLFIKETFNFKNNIWNIMNAEEAEMVKYASNFMLAAKLTCANQIANICGTIKGVDAVKVMEAVSKDSRIGEKFLKIGIGYGGSCFPKDIDGLIYFAESRTSTPVLKAIQTFNNSQRLTVINMLENAIGARKIFTNWRSDVNNWTTTGNISDVNNWTITSYLPETAEITDFAGKWVAVLGLAFKENTDDTRKTPAKEILDYILARNGNVKVYDPKAKISTMFNQEELSYWGSRLIVENGAKFALKDTDAVIIVTPWDEFKALTPEDFHVLMKTPVVIDGRRIFDPKIMEEAGIDYYAIGYGRNRKEIPEID